MELIYCPYCEDERFDIVEERTVSKVLLRWDLDGFDGRVIPHRIEGTLKTPIVKFVCNGCGSDYTEFDFRERAKAYQ